MMNEEIANQIDQIRRAWDSVQLGKEALSKGLTNLFESVTEKYPHQITVAMAIERLRWEFEKDKEPGSYYHSWERNIAAAFYDEYMKYNPHAREGNQNILHTIANNAARNFLNMLCSQTNTENKKPKP